MPDATAAPVLDAPVTTPPPDTEPPAADDPDPAVLRRELDAARKEAAKYRTDARRLEAAAKATEDAEKTELQKALDELAAIKEERDSLAGRYRDRDLQLAAQTEAIRLGYRRPERAVREIDPGAVEYDDDGQPTNIARLLEAELKSRPELKADRPVPPDAGAGNRGKPTLTLDQIRAMSPEEIADREQEVDEAMAAIAAGR